MIKVDSIPLPAPKECKVVILAQELLLVQDVQPGKQTQGVVEVEVVDVAVSFFVQQFQ